MPFIFVFVDLFLLQRIYPFIMSLSGISFSNFKPSDRLHMQIVKERTRVGKSKCAQEQIHLTPVMLSFSSCANNENLRGLVILLPPWVHV